MNTKQIDIKGGNNQILPNAVQAVQVFIGDEYLNRKSRNSDNSKVGVMNTPFFSMTMNFHLFTINVDWKFSFDRW